MEDNFVSIDEFMEYHRNVSFVFDDDTHFVLVCNGVWGVNAKRDPYERLNNQN